MNREIKFRGKTPSGVWVFGFYVKSWFSKSSYIIPEDIDEVYNPHDEVLCVEHTGQVGWREVNPQTVGQFTGLSDKGGKDIYEGDLCRYITDTEGVEMDYGSWLWGEEFLCNIAEYSEVIGNIHDEASA
jgi:hypothetical protein